MCGIAGIFGRPDPGEAVRRMLGRIAHRGPDDEGVWTDGDASLGQRRLAIIDLSPAGHQPMLSADGRWAMTLNGEIYNYRELRAELEPFAWRGHSDSEVFLEAIARLGVEETLARAKGMFAFALWDRQARTAYLARDRFGEKPLCYWAEGRALAFASELTALEALDDVPGDLSPEALRAYFRYGYVPSPLSILNGVRKLEPGTMLAWRAGEAPVTKPYWRLAETIAAGRSNRFTDADSAAAAFDATFRAAVERQMISDVPLGCFLSGGIDSSLVAAVMQSVAGASIRTFTLGFDSPEFNEAEHAAAVARHIGSAHTEYVVTAADALAVAPRLGALYDEPFADSSQIPAYLISKMARPVVTVCLTGDGSDEMFGGYVRYPGVLRLWNAAGRLPGKRILGRALAGAPLPLIEGALGWLGPLADRYAARGALGPSVRRAGRWLQADTREALFEAAMTFWPEPGPLAGAVGEARATWRPDRPAFDNEVEPMMWRDAVDYLPGDILVKVDRAAMAVGLETRAPFLDPDVAALAWRLPPEMKVNGATTKQLVRTVLAGYVPPALTERPKVGFTVPLHAWLTGGLRTWARDLLDPALLRRQGLLDPAKIQTAWKTLENGDSGLGAPIWSVLMLQSWLAARGAGA